MCPTGHPRPRRIRNHFAVRLAAMAETHKSALPYAPILLGAAFIATLFIVAESGYQRIHQAGQIISEAEERQALMARYLRLMLDAESAQRGFLLTEDPRYLRNFDPAVRGLDPMLDRIVLQLREAASRRMPTRRRRCARSPARRSARCRWRSASTARSAGMPRSN